MTTATAVPPVVPAKVIFQGNVAIEKIVVREQVRKKFDENAHKELTESVRTKGVINPVTLRPIHGQLNKYELVAGERRFRAAKAAKLKEIPATVRELDDQAAALYQVEENVHRRDLTPIEEARGFKLLLDAKKFTVEQLAQLVDKSLPYVYRAVHLLELPKQAVEAIEDGRFTPAHGHQILRVPPFEREALVKDALENGYDGRISTAAELRNTIEAKLGNDLAFAKFPKDKSYAGMTACTGCPSNTGNQGVLFDGSEKGSCMNRQCFTTKTTQHRADFLEKTRLARLDAKFVEYARGIIYAGTFRTGGYIVKAPYDSAKPPKGDFGLMISASFEVWVAVADRKRAMEQGADGPVKADPTERLIEQRAATAVAQAVLTASAEDPRKALRVTCTRLVAKLYGQQEEAFAAFKVVSVEGLQAWIEKAILADLAAAAAVLSGLTNYNLEDFAQEMGVNMRAIRKATEIVVKKEIKAVIEKKAP